MAKKLVLDTFTQETYNVIIRIMKKVIILVIIFTFIFSVNTVEARFPDDLPGPEIMPDSPFYFLKLFWEKVVLFFTFGAERKAEKYITFAEKRAYEAKQMLEEGKEELAEKLRETYKYYLNKALDKLEMETRKALKYRTEEVQQQLEKRTEEIKNKLKESINL